MPRREKNHAKIPYMYKLTGVGGYNETPERRHTLLLGPAQIAVSLALETFACREYYVKRIELEL